MTRKVRLTSSAAPEGRGDESTHFIVADPYGRSLLLCAACPSARACVANCPAVRAVIRESAAAHARKDV